MSTPTPPTTVFTVRHRKALGEVLTDGLTHAQLDALTQDRPVLGDPGNGAGKAGRVELIVATLMDEPGQARLLDALPLIDPDALHPAALRQWQMLSRRLNATGHPLPAPPAPESKPKPKPTTARAAAADPAEPEEEAAAPVAGRRAAKKAARRRRARAPQLVALGGTAELVDALTAMEGVHVIHVPDHGTRAQAVAAMSAVTTALQTPGAVIAIGGPPEMIGALSLDS